MPEPYRLSVETDKISYKVDNSFGDKGNEINISVKLPYSSLQSAYNIKSCGECPVGYMKNNCGRRVPLDCGCVPDTCKLKRLSLGDLLRTLADCVDAAEITK